MKAINESNYKKSECYRRGNTVGPRLTSKTQKSLNASSSKVLKDLKSKKHKTRLLLDYLTVTITPKIAKNGWEFRENIGKEKIKNYGLYDFKPMGKIKDLEHDDFFDYLIETFDDLFDFSKDYEENKGGGGAGAGGGGYNYGRVYELGKSDAKVYIKSFNPDNSDRFDSDYAVGSKHNQFIHQKVMIDLSGDAIQYLRSKGNLLNFILRLYRTFPTTVTKFDIAMDFFNYGLKPKYFSDLYDKDYYIGRSKVNLNGDSKEPTVYIGAYKGNETVMLYDKILESKAKGGSDEPELLKVLEDTGGDWFRLEQHYSNDKRKAEQAFGFIVFTLLQEFNIVENLEARFIELMSSLLYERLTAPQKPRFLSKKRKDRNNIRVSTDKKWEMILNEIDNVKIDFVYMRPELTIQERMDNFKYRGLGGTRLFQDIIKEKGEQSYLDFMNEVGLYQIEKSRELEEESA